MRTDNKKTLVLPLMMYGVDGFNWHRKGKPIMKKKIVGYTRYKSGKKKGQKKPIREWVVHTQKRKVFVGYDGVYKSGKNKGKPKKKYETQEVPAMSTGFFPTVNHMYNTDFGGMRGLKEIAKDKMEEWQLITKQWADANSWVTVVAPVKVAVDLVFWLPKGNKDTHNAKKLLLDSLEGIIHVNDYYIIDRTIDFGIDEENPRIEANIYIPHEQIEIG